MSTAETASTPSTARGGAVPAARKRRHASAVTLLALVVAVNVVVGSVLFLARVPAAPGRSTAAPHELPAQVKDVQAAIDEGRHGEGYALALSDADLTALADYFLAETPESPFAGVKVVVTGDRVVAEGVAKALAVPVPVRATAVVGARDGVPWAKVEDVSLGQVALPGAVRERTIREVNASLDFSRYAMPITVDTLELRPGGLTVRGTVK